MTRRKFWASTAAAAAVVSALALTAGSASAVTSNPQPDDTAGTATLPMLIGVGSDTTQHAVKLVSDAFNAQTPAPTNPIFTYAACATPTTCGTITLPSGDINRPNGSGAGKTTLFGASNNTDIDFARSSSAESAAEVSAGLQSFPFALDTLVMTVSGNVASHAPGTLTPAQIVGIYKGDIKNWNEVGGTTGLIKPKTPQPGSGTRTFWDGQLAAMNGGAPVVYGSNVVEVQEHDPAPIQDDADAIAPFSQGRAALAGTLHVENGFAANRAVYNVVRGADVGKSEVLAAFGSSGFFCSAAAKPLIAQAGFTQFLAPNKGGVCGAPTQSATSNFATAQVQTTTKVTVTSASGSSARITAAIAGAGTNPSDGTVAFFEGGTQLASGVPLISGQAARIQATTSGTHTYRAVYTPAANSVFLGSEGTGTGTVSKAASTLKTDFPKSVTLGKKIKGSVTVTLTGSSNKATGTVKVMNGKKVVGTGTLRNGVAKINLKLTKAGTYKLVASWGGDASGNGSTAKFKVKVVKPKKK